MVFNESDSLINEINLSDFSKVFPEIKLCCLNWPVENIEKSYLDEKESREEIKKTKFHLQQVLNENISDSLRIDEFIVSVGGCNGDDMIAVTISSEKYHLTIFDSRVLTIIVKVRSLQQKQEKEDDIKKISLEIANDIFKKSSNAKFKYYLFKEENFNESKYFSFFLKGDIYKSWHNEIGCTSDGSIFLFYLVNLNNYPDNLSDQEKNQKLRNPEPYIKFPELRQKLKVKKTYREIPTPQIAGESTYSECTEIAPVTTDYNN